MEFGEKLFNMSKLDIFKLFIYKFSQKRDEKSFKLTLEPQNNVVGTKNVSFDVNLTPK